MRDFSIRSEEPYITRASQYLNVLVYLHKKSYQFTLSPIYMDTLEIAVSNISFLNITACFSVPSLTLPHLLYLLISLSPNCQIQPKFLASPTQQGLEIQHSNFPFPKPSQPSPRYHLPILGQRYAGSDCRLLLEGYCATRDWQLWKQSADLSFSMLVFDLTSLSFSTKIRSVSVLLPSTANCVTGILKLHKENLWF